MSGKTVKRVETTTTFDPELRVNVRDQVWIAPESVMSRPKQADR